jgi:hypothetical protein
VTSDSLDHAWVEVCIDGTRKMLDTTWNDPDNPALNDITAITQEYFLKDDLYYGHATDKENIKTRSTPTVEQENIPRGSAGGKNNGNAAPSVIEQPKGVSSVYRQYVLAPLSDGETDVVILKSADMILTFDSNMAYTMTDKRTNTVKSGKMRFAAGMTRKNLNTVESSKVYLWETDAAETQTPRN